MLTFARQEGAVSDKGREAWVIAKLLAVVPSETSIRLEENWWEHLSLWTEFFLHWSSNHWDLEEGAAGVRHFMSCRMQRLGLYSSLTCLLMTPCHASLFPGLLLQWCVLIFCVTPSVCAVTIGKWLFAYVCLFGYKVFRITLFNMEWKSPLVWLHLVHYTPLNQLAKLCNTAVFKILIVACYTFAACFLFRFRYCNLCYGSLQQQCVTGFIKAVN